MSPSRSWRQAVEALHADLLKVVDVRLRALVVYEAHGLLGDAPPPDGDIRHDDHVHTLAVIEGLGYWDLARLAPLADTWARRGLAVPLFFAPGELRRSLDAFPLEFGQMVARHVVIAGADPFEGLDVADRDLRRACEAQARSHLLHLREGFIQSAGNPKALAALVAASAIPLRALLVNLARLHGVQADSADALAAFVAGRLRLRLDGLRPLLSAKRPADLSEADAGAFFPAYLAAVEQLVTLIDEWSN